MRILGILLAVSCEKKEPVETGKAGNGSPEETTDLPDQDCTSFTLGASGGEIDATDLEVRVPAGALAGDTELSLCVSEAPAGFEVHSTVWTLSGASLLGPVTVELQTDGASDLALFVPSVDGAQVRCIEQDASRPEELTGPVYRDGTFFAAVDPRVQVPYQRAGSADLLFVVDNSCSMFDNQARLAGAFPQIAEILVSLAVDYHVGVVSTDLDFSEDKGRLKEVDGARSIDPDTADPEEVFQQMAQMGTLGSAREQGIGATYMALEQLRDTYNAGFLRPGAPLSVVVMSDERDQTRPNLITQPELSQYLLDLESTGGARVSFHSLVTMNGADAGVAYLDTTDEVGGFSESILAPTWGDFFEDVLDEFAYSPGLNPVPAGAIEAWDDPADGQEPFLLPADSISYDPSAQTATVTSDLVSPEDVLWLLYAPL